MLNIKETIVVEGKGDARNLSRVCDANYIITSGLHISSKTYNEIELAIKTSGIIVFTDPDSAGKSIRQKIEKRFSEYSSKIKHAYISAREGRKNGDLGVENASEESLIKALGNLKAEIKPNADDLDNSKFIPYTIRDMYDLSLAGSPNASANRKKLCEELNIGYSNAKVLCKKLNSYQIPMDLIKKVTSP